MSKITLKENTIRLLICILLPLITSSILMFIFAAIISKTAIPEQSTAVFSVISSAVCCIMMALFFVLNFKIKGILCTIISFSVMLIIKLILTVIISGGISMTGQGMAGIGFLALFCFVGTLLGLNIKK